MSDLARTIDALAGTPVLCVGDVMLDRYIYGTVERISPEAPIPVLKVNRQTTMLGGAGNVTANLTALGCTAHFISVIGDDDAGAAVLRLLVEQGLADRCHMVTEPNRQTSVKTRYVAAHQQLLRADSESVAPIHAPSEQSVIDAVRSILPEVRCLILSDYGKGVLTESVIQTLIASARSAGRPVVVDPKARDYRWYRGADVITPNRKELAQATGMPVGTAEEIVAAGRVLIAECNLKAVVATRSEEGMTVITAADEVVHLPAQAREVYDVSGAGDTAVAALAGALGTGASLPVAAQLATLAAGIVVGKVGTAVVRIPELVAVLHQQEWQTTETKVATLDATIDQVARWRRHGLRVGFTNGCFDLLHPGHVHLLSQARASCDRLVVGLNSDESVRGLKGPKRPVQTEASRAAVLASLATVDLVVIFAEDTPLRLIEAIRPDVLVKGADYRADQVVGGEIVRGYGGRVMLAELAPGHSTTATINRLNA